MGKFFGAQRLIATRRAGAICQQAAVPPPERARSRRRTAMNHCCDVVYWDGPVGWTGQQADSVSLVRTTCVRSIAARHPAPDTRVAAAVGAGQGLLAYLEFRARVQTDGWTGVRAVGSDRRTIDHPPPKARNLTPRDGMDCPAEPVRAGRAVPSGCNGEDKPEKKEKCVSRRAGAPKDARLVHISKIPITLSKAETHGSLSRAVEDGGHPSVAQAEMDAGFASPLIAAWDSWNSAMRRSNSGRKWRIRP
uniref:Uncharacterized protein n=1 Tax=Plectus sambesii TaxID=2011161 RepID=A0A914VWH6_9BILA